MYLVSDCAHEELRRQVVGAWPVELDEVWEGFLWRLGGVCCFWIDWVWVEDVDEKVAVLYADHDEGIPQ